jgi:hypothetical protein
MRHTAGIALAMGLAMTLPGSASGQHHAHAYGPAKPGTIAIPSAMQAEHAGIHQRLERATALPGRTGAAARALAEVLHPHFLREEQIGLPPLGLLEPLARGEFTEAMTAVLPLTDSLRAELPRMLEEHKAIHAATVRLGDAAKAESQAEAAALASELAAHALAEEQLFYPAALLVGEVVKNRAGAHGHH